LPGVRFRAALFEPTFHKHAKRPCGGAQIHVTDRQAFRPVESAIALLDACRRASPSEFAWREPPYEYEAVKMPFDILSGSARERLALDMGADPRDIARSWAPEVEAFEKVRANFLLY
jgi:uncharacterized protein YbbC (DUF1343 family)